MRTLFWIIFSNLLLFSSIAEATEIDKRCLRPDDQTQTNAACIKNFDACSYIMGFGAEFGALQIIWLEDGAICGWNYDGHRLDGRNSAPGKLSVRLFKPDVLNEWGGPANGTTFSLHSTAKLKKTITEKMIVWHGSTEDVGFNINPELVFLQKRRFFEREEKPSNEKFVDEYVKLKTKEDPDFYINEGHGAYYCGDGGCSDNHIFVYVDPSKSEEYMYRLKASNLDVVSTVWSEDPEVCSGLHVEKNVNLLCSVVEAVPLRSPEVTMLLRDLPGVVTAYRSGGGAGADATSFFLSTNEFLKDSRTMDGFKAAAVFDKAIRLAYPTSSYYEISDVEFSDNSLKWNVIGRSDALQRVKNPSRDQKNEWWKIRIQLAVLQKNAGEYFLSLGLPETRVTTWGFSSTPSADKFVTELTNDRRFLEFRNRIMSAIAFGVPGNIEIP